ncbi:MAG: hypothetical protein ACPGVN_03130 [Alphaproteobacteria bacterium]
MSHRIRVFVSIVFMCFVSSFGAHAQGLNSREDKSGGFKALTYNQLATLFTGNTLVGRFVDGQGIWAEYLSPTGNAVFASSIDGSVKGRWGVNKQTVELCFVFDIEPKNVCYFVEKHNETNTLMLVESKTVERYFLIEHVCVGDLFGLGGPNPTFGKQATPCQKLNGG